MILCFNNYYTVSRLRVFSTFMRQKGKSHYLFLLPLVLPPESSASSSQFLSHSCPSPPRHSFSKGFKKKTQRSISLFFFPNETSGPRLDDDGPVRPARPVEQPDVGYAESEVPGLRVAQIPVHGFEHDGEPRSRGARIRTELRQLLPDARRPAQHPLFPVIREPVPEFGEPRAESGGGQLQREAGGSETGQQRVEALLRSKRRELLVCCEVVSWENFSRRKKSRISRTSWTIDNDIWGSLGETSEL